MPRSSITIGQAIPPVPVGLKIIAKLTDQQLSKIASAIKDEERFDLSEDRLENLRLALALEPEDDVTKLLASLDFLYSVSHSYSDSDDSWTDKLRHFLNSTGLIGRLGDPPEPGIKKLEQLLFDNPGVDRRMKREWLETGVLDRLSGFASFVDLRPNFDAKRHSVTELIPVVIVCVEIASPTGDQSSVSLQLTPKEFQKLRKSIEDIESKLITLRSTFKSDVPMYLGE